MFKNKKIVISVGGGPSLLYSIEKLMTNIPPLTTYNKICIAGNCPKSVEKLVEEIYVGLEPHFVVAAGINVSLTLDKLQNDAKVSETAEGWLKK